MIKENIKEIKRLYRKIEDVAIELTEMKKKLKYPSYQFYIIAMLLYKINNCLSYMRKEYNI